MRDLVEAETRFQMLNTSFEKIIPIMKLVGQRYPELPGLAEDVLKAKAQIEEILDQKGALKGYLQARRHDLEKYGDFSGFATDQIDPRFSIIENGVRGLLTGIRQLEHGFINLTVGFRKEFNLPL